MVDVASLGSFCLDSGSDAGFRLQAVNPEALDPQPLQPYT